MARPGTCYIPCNYGAAQGEVETNVGKPALVGRQTNGQYVTASAEASFYLVRTPYNKPLSFRRGRGLLGGGRGPAGPQNACTNHGIAAHDSGTRPAKDPCALDEAVFLGVTGRVLQCSSGAKSVRTEYGYTIEEPAETTLVRIQPASSVRPAPRPGRETAPDLACDTAKHDGLT